MKTIPVAEPLGKGTEFRAHYLDCALLWRVVCPCGRRAFEVVGVDEDNLGIRKAFLRTEIERALAYEASCARDRGEHEAFYAGLPLGSTVHYHYGFGCWIRCEVVKGWTRDMAKGFHPCLRPKALLGPWCDGDMRADAHYPMRIARRELFEPHAANIFESGKVNRGDPRALEVRYPPDKLGGRG